MERERRASTVQMPFTSSRKSQTMATLESQPSMASPRNNRRSSIDMKKFAAKQRYNVVLLYLLFCDGMCMYTVKVPLELNKYTLIWLLLQTLILLLILGGFYIAVYACFVWSICVVVSTSIPMHAFRVMCMHELY